MNSRLSSLAFQNTSNHSIHPNGPHAENRASASVAKPVILFTSPTSFKDTIEDKLQDVLEAPTAPIKMIRLDAVRNSDESPKKFQPLSKKSAKGYHIGIGGAGNRVLFDKKPSSTKRRPRSTFSYIPLESQPHYSSRLLSAEGGHTATKRCDQLSRGHLNIYRRFTLQRASTFITKKTRGLLKTDYDGVKHESGFWGGIGWRNASPEARKNWSWRDSGEQKGHDATLVDSEQSGNYPEDSQRKIKE